MPAVFLTDPTGPGIGAAAAMRIGDVYACVRVLAESAASLPLIAYRRTTAGRVRAGGRVQELLDAPAPAVTTASFIGQVLTHLNLWGNCYLGKYRDENGRVTVLAPLPPESVQVELERGEPIYTVFSLDRGVTRHTRDDVLHIRSIVSEDGLLGMTPIKQGAGVLTLNSELARHATDTMTRGARLSGVLSTPADAIVDPDNIDGIKAEIQESWVGPQSSGGVALVTGGLAFSPLSMPLADAQFIEQRQLSAQEIARIFRVPPWMVGVPSGDSLTYATVEGQATAFVRFSLAPWLTVVEQALSSDRDLMPSTTYVEFLADGLLRGDSKTRAEVYTAALNPQTGWMSRDEVRRAENLPAEGEAAA